MPDERSTKSFAVFAMLRDGLSEQIVALNPDEAEARKFARKVAVAVSEKFVRCRVRRVNMTMNETITLVFGWGREDALAGEPLEKTTLPKPYAAAYRRGFRAGFRDASRAGGEGRERRQKSHEQPEE